MNHDDSLIFYTPDEALKVAIASDFIMSNPPMQEARDEPQA